MLAVARNPNNFVDRRTQTLDSDWVSAVGKFPSCSEKLILFVKVDGEQILDMKWEGSGSSVMVASASLTTDMLKTKTIDEALELCDKIFECFSGTRDFVEIEPLMVLQSVMNYPRRVRSAILSAHAVKLALNKIRNINAANEL